MRTVKVLNIGKKLLNIVDKSVKYHILGCVLPNVINILLKKLYRSFTFIQNEKYQSGVMTSARIQPFCRRKKMNIGCFDGMRINPRNITQGETALKIHTNQFCLIW